MAVRIHPGADADTKEAVEFILEQGGADLADEFIESLDDALQRISQFPYAWPKKLGARCHVMRRFPFSVFYRVESGVTHIIAVAHQKRRPGYWSDRA